MLPVALRLPLRKNPDFFKQSRFERSDNFLLWWQKSDSPHHGQAAVIVSKKTAPLATQRNLIKRKLRSALGKAQPLWLKKKIVIQVVQRAVMKHKLNTIEQELIGLLS